MALRGPPHHRAPRRTTQGPTLQQTGAVFLLVFIALCCWQLPHTHRTLGRRLGVESGIGGAEHGTAAAAQDGGKTRATPPPVSNAGGTVTADTAGQPAAAARASAAAAGVKPPPPPPPAAAPVAVAIISPSPAGADSPAAAAALPALAPPTAAPSAIRHVAADGRGLEIVGGVFITGGTSRVLIDAFRDAAAWYNGNRTGSHVKLLFFVGNEGHPLQMQPGGDDIVAGTFGENMDGGKTFEWWTYTATTYPNADYILKIDTDSAVNWGKLLPMLGRPNGPVLVGHLNTHESCGGFGHCPPKNCTNMDAHCWVYMSGGFYGMSSNLTRTVAGCKYAQTNRYGPEDAVSGRAVKNCAVGRTNVTHIRNGIAWCHGKRNTEEHIRYGYFPKGCGE